VASAGAEGVRGSKMSDRIASDKGTVTVVIPLYNEQEILEQNLAKLAPFFDELIGPNRWLFLLVENGSTDRTPQLIAEMQSRWPAARAIHLREPNYGAALKAGLRAATTRWTFLLDIEQWDLPFIRWAWQNRHDYDLFVASKRGDPTICRQTPYRRLLSCGLNALYQLFLGFTGTDTHGPKLLDREALKPLIDVCQLDRGHFDSELVLRALRHRLRVVEVPIEYEELRPPRNWMIKKIVWNVLALRRLIRVMKDVPYEGSIRMHRFSREDVLAEIERRPAVAVREVRA
jgi:glycosyltransferase involved in cell wall biosynthesis